MTGVQTCALPIFVYISDIHALGLDTAKGMVFIDSFYWDRDDETRRWSKRFFDRRGVIPTMAHAGVYSAALHYLRAVQLANTDDGRKVAAKMRELPVEDFFAKKGEVRANGRMAHDMYLVQVKRRRVAVRVGLLPDFANNTREYCISAAG